MSLKSSPSGSVSRVRLVTEVEAAICELAKEAPELAEVVAKPVMESYSGPLAPLLSMLRVFADRVYYGRPGAVKLSVCGQSVNYQDAVPCRFGPEYGIALPAYLIQAFRGLPAGDDGLSLYLKKLVSHAYLRNAELWVEPGYCYFRCSRFMLTIVPDPSGEGSRVELVSF